MPNPNQAIARKCRAVTGRPGLPRMACWMAAGLASALALVAPLGCFGPGRALPTAETLLAVPAGQRSSDSLERLAHGRRLMLTSCTECHGIYYPEEFPPGEWPHLVADMRMRANLSPEEAGEVTAYLQAASAAARQPHTGKN